jgi:hypothetical protein
MKNGVHLQGFKGYFEGTKAIDIKVGDVLVWNYGLLSKVISKEISPSGKSVYLITQSVTKTVNGEAKYGMLRRNRYNINTLLVTNPLVLIDPEV